MFFDDKEYDDFIENIVPTIPKIISSKELEKIYYQYYYDICIKKFGVPSKKDAHGFDIDNKYDLASLLSYKGIKVRTPIVNNESKYQGRGFSGLTQFENELNNND